MWPRGPCKGSVFRTRPSGNRPLERPEVARVSRTSNECRTNQPQDVTMSELADFLTWCGHVLLSGTWPERGYMNEDISRESRHKLKTSEAWCLTSLQLPTAFASKEFPTTSHHYKNRGKRISGSFRFAFSALLSDNKQKVECHRFFGRNWMSNFICEECWASKKFEEFNYGNHADDAPWRLAPISHEQYVHQTRLAIHHIDRLAGLRKYLRAGRIHRCVGPF